MRNDDARALTAEDASAVSLATSRRPPAAAMTRVGHDPTTYGLKGHCSTN
jgi:hypothetical protein